MNVQKLAGMVVAGVALVSVALAADTSSTINVRRNITPIGLQPTLSVLMATSTATGSFTVDLPAPRGKSSIVSTLCNTLAADGSLKGLKVSDTTGIVTVSNGPSASLVVGDQLRCHVVSY